MSSSQEKKRLIRRVRALKRALKRSAQETSTPPPPTAPDAGSAAPRGEEEPVSGLHPVEELVMERMAITRPHLYGLTQAKREALAIRNLNKALSPDSPDKVMLSASRNVLLMESEEQKLAAREANAEAKKPAEQAPAPGVNVNVVNVCGGSSLDHLYERILATQQGAIPGHPPANGAGQSVYPPRADSQAG